MPSAEKGTSQAYCYVKMNGKQKFFDNLLNMLSKEIK